jgi:hypothetical protein
MYGPLTPVVMVMRGLVCHPLFCMALISVSYLLSLCVRAWSGNMSWQYANSINWTMVVGEGEIGVCAWFGAPIIHRTFDISLA